MSVPLQTRAQKELLWMKHISLMKIRCPVIEMYGDGMTKHFRKEKKRKEKKRKEKNV